jgi:hypothetical protein
MSTMSSLSFEDLSYQAAFSTTSPFCLDGKIDRLGNHPVAAGGYADVWRGSFGIVPVAIKVMRPFESNGGRIQQNKLLKVSSVFSCAHNE